MQMELEDDKHSGDADEVKHTFYKELKNKN